MKLQQKALAVGIAMLFTPALGCSQEGANARSVETPTSTSQVTQVVPTTTQASNIPPAILEDVVSGSIECLEYNGTDKTDRFFKVENHPDGIALTVTNRLSKVDSNAPREIKNAAGKIETEQTFILPRGTKPFVATFESADGQKVSYQLAVVGNIMKVTSMDTNGEVASILTASASPATSSAFIEYNPGLSEATQVTIGSELNVIKLDASNLDSNTKLPDGFSYRDGVLKISDAQIKGSRSVEANSPLEGKCSAFIQNGETDPIIDDSGVMVR